MPPFQPDLTAAVTRRLGKSAFELGESDTRPSCPDIMELSDGNIAVIGVDATAAYADELPEGFGIGENERLVVIPRSMLIAAKPDIPDV